ncbi:adenosine deaminase-like protein [Trichonephila clavata]|uniref:Adenosine deaminase-like protein n=1 Tax=Trichonephila clavata TaxID=2740835 RepID=A0A8X6F2P1_TRICU|nr:adenosine deaminase-like protein [Trichonephila clavata]
MELNVEEMQLQTFIKMPKIELHAHLNGSLSHRTLQKLIDLKKKCGMSGECDLKLPCLTSNDLSECFKVFDLIHEITDSLEAIYVMNTLIREKPRYFISMCPIMKRILV